MQICPKEKPPLTKKPLKLLIFLTENLYTDRKVDHSYTFDSAVFFFSWRKTTTTTITM